MTQQLAKKASPILWKLAKVVVVCVPACLLIFSIGLITLPFVMIEYCCNLGKCSFVSGE